MHRLCHANMMIGQLKLHCVVCACVDLIENGA